MGFFSVCDQPFDSARSCVGNVDNVLHNFKSVPCLTLAVLQNRNDLAVDRLLRGLNLIFVVDTLWASMGTKQKY